MSHAFDSRAQTEYTQHLFTGNSNVLQIIIYREIYILFMLCVA